MIEKFNNYYEEWCERVTSKKLKKYSLICLIFAVISFIMMRLMMNEVLDMIFCIIFAFCISIAITLFAFNIVKQDIETDKEKHYKRKKEIEVIFAKEMKEITPKILEDEEYIYIPLCILNDLKEECETKLYAFFEDDIITVVHYINGESIEYYYKDYEEFFKQFEVK